MKIAHCLPIVLLAALACGDDGTTVGTEVGGGNIKGNGKGNTADGGTKRDGGKVTSSGGGNGKPTTTTDTNGRACDKIDLAARPNSPDILIVLDRSGSMVGLGDARNAGKNRWEPSVSAVKTLTSSLTDTVAFGLMLFPSPGGGGGGGGGGITIPGIGTFPTGGGSSCAPGVVDVPVAISTADEIAEVLDRSAPDVGATPTAASLDAARGALDNVCADCDQMNKYVLLVTDGQPTCGDNPAGDDIDATNAAIDALSAANIKTYVIGYDTASDPASAAVMDGFAQHGGTGMHFPVEDEATLVAELTRIAGALVPCEFELGSDIPDPTYVRVEIDGVSYKFGDDWTIQDRKVVLDPMGGACPVLRDAKVHQLNITRECEIVVVQ